METKTLGNLFLARLLWAICVVLIGLLLWFWFGDPRDLDWTDLALGLAIIIGLGLLLTSSAGLLTELLGWGRSNGELDDLAQAARRPVSRPVPAPSPVRALLAAVPSGQIALGHDREGAVTAVPPMVLGSVALAGQQGSGTAHYAQILLAQECRLGAALVVITPQPSAEAWATLTPWTLATITASAGGQAVTDFLNAALAMLRVVQREIDARVVAGDHTPLAAFSRLVVVIDEASRLIGQQATRTEQQLADACRVVLSELLFRGRELNINLYLIVGDEPGTPLGPAGRLLGDLPTAFATSSLDASLAERLFPDEEAILSRLAAGFLAVRLQAAEVAFRLRAPALGPADLRTLLADAASPAPRLALEAAEYRVGQRGPTGGSRSGAVSGRPVVAAVPPPTPPLRPVAPATGGPVAAGGRTTGSFTPAAPPSADDVAADDLPEHVRWILATLTGRDRLIAERILGGDGDGHIARGLTGQESGKAGQIVRQRARELRQQLVDAGWSDPQPVPIDE